jgi:V/A-type H+-transporting ATPase subunit B
LYAQGRDLRRLVAIIGEAALSADDRLVLNFARDFEQKFIGQGEESRSIEQTLDFAWEILKPLPTSLLKRIPREYLEKYRGQA